MKAYHGDGAVKEKYLARVRAHAAADELRQGATIGRSTDGSFHGCAVVCTLERYDHAAYETELGVPLALAFLEDGIFEGMDWTEAKLWPEQFLAAIPVGADLSGVADRFLFWLLLDAEHGVIRFAKREGTKAAIERVGELYRRKMAGEAIDKTEWQAAHNAADAADAHDWPAATAAAAAKAQANHAAILGAHSSPAASFNRTTKPTITLSAPRSAAASALADAAYKTARKTQAVKLLELLRAAPAAALQTF